MKLLDAVTSAVAWTLLGGLALLAMGTRRRTMLRLAVRRLVTARRPAPARVHCCDSKDDEEEGPPPKRD